MSNPNLDPNPSQRSHIVKDALDALGHKFKPLLPSDTEQLIGRAIEVSKRVGELTRKLDMQATMSGLPHDRKALATVISREFKEEFGQWDKDSLLYLLVFIHVDLAVDALTGATDTKKILSL